jgi:hypothetical protein
VTEESSAAGTQAGPASPVAGAQEPGPASLVAGGQEAGPAPVALAVARILATSGVRLVWWWPGIVVALAVYAAVALAAYHDSYPNLWGGLAAGAAAVSWYGSPMRRLEGRRRDRLRARQGL